jgi:hypothetical protein
MLTATSGASDFYWVGIYFNIYQANAAIEGLAASPKLPVATKIRLTAEAKFLRAFSHFYLLNYYGDIPLVLTSSYETNSLIARTPLVQVYQQMVADLKEAQNGLPSDYSASLDEKTRANSWAAAAMLARAYLYQEKWDSAEAQSTAVINSGMYSLVSNLDSAFLKNNSESILQLQQNFMGYGSASTPEGFQFIPVDSISSPNYFITPELLNDFEPGDLRRTHWVNSTNLNDGNSITTYYYPYKYKVRLTTVDNIMEYPVLLRLAEQYLIRAEARAEQNVNLSGAISDLNVIRNRAGLPSLDNSLTQTQVLAAIAHERRIEFFAELGHRWFDLKRTNQADAVLAPIKPTWKPTAVLYPIPFTEMQTDPNLRQNPGY